MQFIATKAQVFNRGRPPDGFLTQLVLWGRSAADVIFAPNPNPKDIYAYTKPELGPWESLEYRKSAMLEVMRVLAGFESSWDWTEGVDTSKLGPDTPENAEAGAWQVSYDSRHIAPELQSILTANNITDGIEFQRVMKFNHTLAMEYIARLMRYTTKANGPLYKGAERSVIRKSLRAPEQSVYPWLSRPALHEFQALLVEPPATG